MVYTKANKVYNKYYTRKDRRSLGDTNHYIKTRRLWQYRKFANQKLRRHKGDVANHGWYKKFDDVQWNAW
jgi:hypothetical protein